MINRCMKRVISLHVYNHIWFNFFVCLCYLVVHCVFFSYSFSISFDDGWKKRPLPKQQKRFQSECLSWLLHSISEQRVCCCCCFSTSCNFSQVVNHHHHQTSQTLLSIHFHVSQRDDKNSKRLNEWMKMTMKKNITYSSNHILMSIQANQQLSVCFVCVEHKKNDENKGCISEWWNRLTWSPLLCTQTTRIVNIICSYCTEVAGNIAFMHFHQIF